MEKKNVFLLALCSCVGLCIGLCIGLSACNKTQSTISDNTLAIDETESIDETVALETVPFEDNLIENLKIYDSEEKATKVFGTIRSDDGNGILTFYDVTIFGEQFTPTVYINDGYVKGYKYILRGYSEAKSEVAYKSIIDNLTKIYSSPYERDDDECIWYFANGTKLHVYISHYSTPSWHIVGIDYSKA